MRGSSDRFKEGLGGKKSLISGINRGKEGGKGKTGVCVCVGGGEGG